MVLLTGSSGAGKTTILNAIEYALYGRTRKPYSHGKTTCGVTMEYTLPNGEFLSIARTSRPNRLVVTYEETEYEDDPAQTIIDGVMGMNYDEFMASSYIVQRLDSSILSMTPTEGVQFIETLAFNDNSHVETKKKIRNFIRECSDVVTSLSGELKVLERQNNAISQNDDTVTEDADETLTAIDLLENQITSTSSNIKEQTVLLSEARARERANKEAREKRVKLEALIEELRNSLSQLTVPPKSDVSNLEKEVQMIESCISRDIQYEAIKHEHSRVQFLKSSHLKAVDATLTNIKSDLLDQDAVDAFRKIIQESSKMSEIANDKRRKDDARKKVSAIFKQIKTMFPDAKDIKTVSAMIAYLKGKTPPNCVVTCPSCEAQLDLVDGRLTIHTTTSRFRNEAFETGATYVYDTKNEAYVGVWDETKKKSRQLKVGEVKWFAKNNLPVFPSDGKMKVADYIALLAEETTETTTSDEVTEEDFATVKEWISQLTALVPDMNIKIPEDAVFDMDSILQAQEQLSAYDSMCERVAMLEVEPLPSSILKLESQVADKIAEFSDYDSYEPSSYTPDDLNSKNTQLGEFKRALAEHASLTKDLNNKMRLFNTLTCDDSEGESQSIEGRLENLNEQLNQARTTLREKERVMSAIRERERYEKLQFELSEAQESLSIAEGRLRGAQGLEEASKQAEILAVERTVENINEHAQLYLAEMFEDPITVRLESFKKAKHGEKPMMNVTIDYKGNTYGSVDELSGGERQRCNLAFLLAVNDMLNSPLLLLDECINNLDSDVNSQVLDIIKSTCDEGKLVLVVSHEAVQGCFDEVVTVS